MHTAENAKTTAEKLLAIPEIEVMFYTTDHYKLLGLQSGENLTQKQISEALRAQLLPCFLEDLPSNLTFEEFREKLRGVDWESFLYQCFKKEHESGSERFFKLTISYYLLSDPHKRIVFECWWKIAKGLESWKIINRGKEKMEEYQLMSQDDMSRSLKLIPWIVGGAAITSPVGVPASICWFIGKSSYKAIRSAVLKVFDDKKAGEGSSGSEDIQDWELVQEDDY